MATRFRSYEPDQTFLFPPRISEWLPDDHQVYFVMDVVRELDLSAIYGDYDGSKGGMPPYDPRMMVGLIVYGYSVGVYSSRKMEKASYESVPFRVLTADQHPDHDTIATFRCRHLEALGSLFGQVLQLCQGAGLVKLGNVALDGTKVRANASRHKAMSYERVLKKEEELAAEVAELFKKAGEVDSKEDALYGEGVRGDELPEELRFKSRRLERIREAKVELERRARERAELEALEKGKSEEEAREAGQKAKPKGKDQYNFTDPESRIMLEGSSKSFQQSYNCQAVVDDKAQVVVAADVVQQTNDKRQLLPMAERMEENLEGRMPESLSADNGYFKKEHIEALEKKTDLLVATGKRKHSDKDEPASQDRSGEERQKPTTKERMESKLGSEAGKEIYGRRKEIVEPVFGQIKEARGFRRFSFRGLNNVRQEWSLLCAVHNLLKLFKKEWTPCLS